MEKNLRGNLINLIAFIAFALFITWLYFQNLSHWKQEREEAVAVADSLGRAFEQMRDKLAYHEENEFLRRMAVYDNLFDPFDSDNFRVYGLYRDIGKKYSDVEVAMMFNITNANSIISRNVIGERWFIVPVKGVHYMMKDETLTEIAQMYYENIADSVLIQRFNLDRGPGNNLIIPFGRN